MGSSVSCFSSNAYHRCKSDLHPVSVVLHWVSPSWVPLLPTPPLSPGSWSPPPSLPETPTCWSEAGILGCRSLFLWCCYHFQFQSLQEGGARMATLLFTVQMPCTGFHSIQHHELHAQLWNKPFIEANGDKVRANKTFCLVKVPATSIARLEGIAPLLVGIHRTHRQFSLSVVHLSLYSQAKNPTELNSRRNFSHHYPQSEDSKQSL